MKRFFFVALMAIIAFACSSEETKVEDAANEFQTVSLANFLDSTENYANKQVHLEGQVVHVCKHSGKKLFLVDNQDRKIKITCGDDIPVFDIALEGSTIWVDGIVEVTKLDEEHCAELEAETIAEIDEKNVDITDKAACEMDAEVERLAGKMSHIEEMRTEMKENGKGYIPVYTVKAIKFQKIES